MDVQRGDPGQLRVADPDGTGDGAEARREGPGAPRVHLLALGQGQFAAVGALQLDEVRPAGFAFGLREDLRALGVGVSIVSPGFVRGAGMWADAEVEAAADDRMTTPDKVARAVARAIERNRNEITVAPRRQRFLTEFGYRHPELAARVQRRSGAERIASELAPARPTSAEVAAYCICDR